jgi:hypothetical protein
MERQKESGPCNRESARASERARERARKRERERERERVAPANLIAHILFVDRLLIEMTKAERGLNRSLLTRHRSPLTISKSLLTLADGDDNSRAWFSLTRQCRRWVSTGDCCYRRWSKRFYYAPPRTRMTHHECMYILRPDLSSQINFYFNVINNKLSPSSRIRFPNERNQPGKTGAPCVEVPGSSVLQ